jgi:hypothetical protein
VVPARGPGWSLQSPRDALVWNVQGIGACTGGREPDCRRGRGGLTVDTGQQAFLSCRSAYRGLLAKLGMTDHAQLQDRFDVTVLFRPNESRFPPPRRR